MYHHFMCRNDVHGETVCDGTARPIVSGHGVGGGGLRGYGDAGAVHSCIPMVIPHAIGRKCGAFTCAEGSVTADGDGRSIHNHYRIAVHRCA